VTAIVIKDVVVAPFLQHRTASNKQEIKSCTIIHKIEQKVISNLTKKSGNMTTAIGIKSIIFIACG